MQDEFPTTAEDNKEHDTRQWAMFLHFSLLAGYAVPMAGLIAPIVIWQVKKEELPGLDMHGKIALNWIVSYLIYGFVCVLARNSSGIVFGRFV